MTDRRSVARGKQKQTGTPTSSLPGLPSTTSSPSSSLSNLTHPNKPKKGIKPFFRNLFGGGKQSTKKQEPPTIVAEANDTSQNAVPATESANAAQDDPLQSRRLDIDLSEDPNHQWKVDAIGYSIQVIDLFENLTDIVGLVVPDALGQALKKITTILEILKVHSSFRLVQQSLINHSGCFI